MAQLASKRNAQTYVTCTVRLVFFRASTAMVLIMNCIYHLTRLSNIASYSLTKSAVGEIYSKV